MKLETALEIGGDCGLETVGECLYNIQIHALSLFPLHEIRAQVDELKLEYEALKRCTNTNNETSREIALELLKQKSTKTYVTRYV